MFDSEKSNVKKIEIGWTYGVVGEEETVATMEG